MPKLFEGLISDRDERPYKEGTGWGPGWYSCECMTCGKSYIGEKRSYQCAPCAYGDEEDTNAKR